MNDPILTLALGDFEREAEVTRSTLERIPGDKLSWRPHERSYSLGELALHITNVVSWVQATLEQDGVNLAEVPPPTQLDEIGGVADILEIWDANAASAREALQGATVDSMGEPWTLSMGEEEIFTLPRGATVRVFAVSHLIHHRAQLGVYLRLLDIPVPASYGPSADEEM